MTNRILKAIEKRRDEIARGVKPDGSPITGDLAVVEASLANTLMEVSQFHSLKSEAYLNGLLNIDEAQTIYYALGEEVPGPDGWAADADLATKIVVTGLMGELASMKIAQAQPESAISRARA